MKEKKPQKPKQEKQSLKQEDKKPKKEKPSITQKDKKPEQEKELPTQEDKKPNQGKKPRRRPGKKTKQEPQPEAEPLKEEIVHIKPEAIHQPTEQEIEAIKEDLLEHGLINPYAFILYNYMRKSSYETNVQVVLSMHESLLKITKLNDIILKELNEDNEG